MPAGLPAVLGAMIFTVFVGEAVCANTPVATQAAASEPAIWRNNLLKAMVPFLLTWIPRLLPGSARLFSRAAVSIIATKAGARPSPAHGPTDAPVAVARGRSNMRDTAKRARS